MRTLAWNCRGAGRAPTVRGFRELIRESNPEIVFLSETKSKSPRINKIKSRLNFTNRYCVEPVGQARGLALFWRLGVELKVMYSNKNMITALVYSNPPPLPPKIRQGCYLPSIGLVGEIKGPYFGRCLRIWCSPFRDLG